MVVPVEEVAVVEVAKVVEEVVVEETRKVGS